MSGTNPILIHNQGAPDEQAYPIRETPATIGRSDEQVICIPHKSLSRSHARIDSSGGRFYIVDLQSKNGTFVNGVKVQEQELRSGDTLTLGDLDLLFVLPRTSVSPSLPSPEPLAVRSLARAPITKVSRLPQGVTLDRKLMVRNRMRVVVEIARLLPASEDLDTLLAKLVDLLFQLLDFDHCTILLNDDKTGRLLPRMVRSSDPQGPAGASYSRNVVDYVVGKDVAALFADTVNDPRLDEAKSVVMQSIRTSMCVPLKVEGEALGVLYVDGRTGAERYTEEDLDFLLTFADQTAAALRNAMLLRRRERETVNKMQLVAEAKLASVSGAIAGVLQEIKRPVGQMARLAASLEELTDEVARRLGAAGSTGDPRADDSLARLREVARTLAEQGRSADAMVERVLLHARRPSSVRGPGDLNMIVAESLRLACTGARGEDAEMLIVEEYDPLMIPLEMTAQDIGSVILSVVDNAIYAMRRKRRALGAAFTPELRVQTLDLGNRAEVKIRDNGTGVTPDIADKIYEPFFTTKPPGQGAGLGLALCREIIEAHRGELVLTSEPGQHTEVLIRLPRYGPTLPPMGDRRQ